MRNNPTNQKDTHGREIYVGDIVKVVHGRIDSLVSEGQKFKVFTDSKGVACIQVGTALSEVAPNYCEIVNNK